MSTKKRTRTGVSLRDWLAAKQQSTRARLGNLMLAETPEQELWAANLTGRITALAELEQQAGEGEDD